LLTDWQIDKLIVEPELKKAEQMSQNTGQRDFEATPAAGPVDLDAVPTEAEFVDSFSRQFGMGKDHWRAVYREQFGGVNGNGRS
jgi:hypothetical protein